MIGQKEIRQVKKCIEQYYHTEKVLAWNRGKLERLTKRLEEIERDRNSPLLPVCLNTDLQGIQYDTIVKSRGLPSSPMDRNIEQIYNTLDKAYEKTQNEMIQLKITIQQLEDSQEQMQYYIHFLSSQSRKLLEYKYNENKSVTQISFLLHLSKSTICRNFYDIYQWLYKMMEYEGAFEKV